VAVNCWVVPDAILGLTGVIAIETSVAEVTVRVVEPDILPDVAEIVVEPAFTEVANPLEPPALLIAATPAFDEFQVIAVVRFCVEPSEYVPVAVNCRVVPLTMLGLIGSTVRDMSVAAVTVRVVDPEILPDAAVIAVDPAVTDVANPLEPAALLMAATPALEEFQVTEAVRSCVVLSENVPVAMNCRVVPLAILGLVGVTVIDTSVAEVTLSTVDPEILPNDAIIVIDPGAVEAAIPLEPFALLMVAMDGAEEFQTTDVVRSCVVLSENVPVAVKCWVVPLTMLALVGVTAMETSLV
jgi:hypothetical protein